MYILCTCMYTCTCMYMYYVHGKSVLSKLAQRKHVHVCTIYYVLCTCTCIYYVHVHVHVYTMYMYMYVLFTMYYVHVHVCTMYMYMYILCTMYMYMYIQFPTKFDQMLIFNCSSLCHFVQDINEIWRNDKQVNVSVGIVSFQKLGHIVLIIS